MTSNSVHIYEIRTIVCNCLYVFSLFRGEALAFNSIVVHHDLGLDAGLLSHVGVSLWDEKSKYATELLGQLFFS
jgi:hypothetical protein